MPTGGEAGGRKLKMVYGVKTQVNGKFSGHGRGSKKKLPAGTPPATTTKQATPRLAEALSRFGHVAGLAIPGAVIGGLAGDANAASLGGGQAPGWAGAALGGVAGGLAGNALHSWTFNDPERENEKVAWRRPGPAATVIPTLGKGVTSSSGEPRKFAEAPLAYARDRKPDGNMDAFFAGLGRSQGDAGPAAPRPAGQVKVVEHQEHAVDALRTLRGAKPMN